MKARQAVSTMNRRLAVLALAALFFRATDLFAAVAGKQIDVAALITKADAESVLGEPVKEAQPRNGEGSDGYYSRCTYHAEIGGKSLMLRVHQSPAKFDSKARFEMLSASTGKLEPFRGLGDRAGYWFGDSSGNEAGRMLLYVAKGNALITVGVSGVTDEVAMLNKAKELARKILAAL